MNQYSSNSKGVAFLTLALCLLLFSACKKNECKEVICNPCPSSRLIIQYQDSTGACPEDFHSNAMITAYTDDSYSTVQFSYNFSDSCMAAFLIEEDYVYVVESGMYHDTIRVDSFSYQPPVEVTSCCFCYPIDHAEVMINDSMVHVHFEEGVYDNSPYIRKIN